MLEYIIPAAAAVVVAVIEAFAAKDRREAKEYRAHREEMEKAREELMVSVVQTGWASIALGEATAIALQQGHTNGETKAALDYATRVKHEQKNMLAKQGIHMMWD